MPLPSDAPLQIDDTTVHPLPNGVRVVTIHQPGAAGASVSVFVRSGSQHERATLNGISHVIEHMAFKGTTARSCQQINLDAERLGAEVNAHTDRDHTAYQMRGLAADTRAFIDMLADLVLNPTFPAAELERERQVILHELTDLEDDAYAVAYRLFDSACYGLHPFARPVIGTRRNIERFDRDALIAHVRARYTGCNLIVAVAGPMPPDEVREAVASAFGHLPAGMPNTVEPPAWRGGIRIKRHSGSSQSQLVLGWPAAPLATQDATAQVAAAVFGEGMSSPLLDQLRERRGLAYHVSANADPLELGSQFVIEAATGSDQLDEFLVETMALLRQQATRIDPVDLERARNQLIVRQLHALERPLRRLEDAAIDLFVLGRVRSAAEQRTAIEAVGAGAVRACFETLLTRPVALAVTGKVPAGLRERCETLFG
ncbi:M16 family metallopeptidase [Leptothrix discophora]|uniref:Pitrilysin family protein n=1 Tax=Leptothrix discophora TaxID=89 RepID=A0ABT9G8A1_LEPDI|nr:pitrilysin family protein [Leptothrix discophora]MDP4302651.1 pitrilysin family protein [Leptothrix discophora]